MVNLAFSVHSKTIHFPNAVRRCFWIVDVHRTFTGVHHGIQQQSGRAQIILYRAQEHSDAGWTCEEHSLGCTTLLYQIPPISMVRPRNSGFRLISMRAGKNPPGKIQDSNPGRAGGHIRARFSMVHGLLHHFQVRFGAYFTYCG